MSTVSRVLNNRPDVSDAVRRTVLAAVEDMGYIPNNSARDLVRSQSDNIGVVVRGTGNLFFSEMLKTVSHEIEHNGYTMVLHQINSDADEVKAGAILEREKKLKGLIFLGGRFDYTPAGMALLGALRLLLVHQLLRLPERAGLFLRFHRRPPDGLLRGRAADKPRPPAHRRLSSQLQRPLDKRASL